MSASIEGIARTTGILFLVIGLNSSAWAGSVLATPSHEAPPGPGESYPESRFGRPPTRVDLGVSAGYASRAVTDLEEVDEETPVRAQRGAEQGRHLASAGNGVPVGFPSKTMPEPDAVSSASTVARKGVQEVALIAGDLGFFPKTVFVTRDVPVRLFVTGASKNTLCLMMDSFQVRKQIRSQKIEEITFTPANPGKYRFYCPVNGMEGTMIVKEFAQSAEQ